jgi:xanthine dehydrogenase accessory factor
MSPMRGISEDFQRWRSRGDRVAVATVVATRKSAPRPVGSKLCVSDAGELAGSVSGGCVENEVYGVAREILEGSEPRVLTYGISDDLALQVGLPCGGEIDVFVGVPDERIAERLLEVARNEEYAVHFTVLDDGRELLVLESGERLGDGPVELAEHADELIRAGRSRVLELEGLRVFADVFGPPPRLVVFGAIDTAEALCKAAKMIGWRTIASDARAKFATRERLPSADEIVVAWPEEALAQIRPDAHTAVVVLTHEERFDIPAVAGALASDAFYVGAIGSRRTQEKRRERLLETGVDEAELERLFGPAGLDVGASTPEETALSILAEIVAVRAGRSGGPLRESSGRIHADVA